MGNTNQTTPTPTKHSLPALIFNCWAKIAFAAVAAVEEGAVVRCCRKEEKKKENALQRSSHCRLFSSFSSSSLVSISMCEVVNEEEKRKKDEICCVCCSLFGNYSRQTVTVVTMQFCFSCLLFSATLHHWHCIIWNLLLSREAEKITQLQSPVKT